MAGQVLRVLIVVVAAAAALRSDAAAAAPWCGAVSATDRPPALGGQSVRVLYGIPSDGADNGIAVAPRIASELDEIDGWWRREDSSSTLRFDTYADPCGSQYDVNAVRFGTVSTGQSNYSAIFSAVVDEVERLPNGRYSKYLVYYDGPATEDICGVGGGSSGGTGVAVVFLQACAGIGTSLVVVHELLHSFGLVDEAAPNECADDEGHVCDSSGDILYPYAQPVPLGSFRLDFGNDDYYRHSGSWFDLQESPWLLRVGEQAAVSVAVTGAGSISSDLPGISCAVSCTTSWNAHTAISLQADPGDGQRFVRWGGACTGDADCQVTVNGTTTVTALFAPASFRLAVGVAGRGTVRSDPSGILASAGRGRAGRFTSYEPVRLVAKAAKGWRFKGWAGSAHGTRPAVSVPMTRNATVRAVFVKVNPKR